MCDKNFKSGHFYMKHRHIDKAIEFFKLSNSINSHYYLGLIYKNLGQIDNAIYWYKLCADKNMKDSLYELALLYIQKKEYSNALPYLEKYNKLSNYEIKNNKAFEELIKISKQNDINSDLILKVNNQLGLNYKKAGQIDNAIETFNLVIRRTYIQFISKKIKDITITDIELNAYYELALLYLQKKEYNTAVYNLIMYNKFDNYKINKAYYELMKISKQNDIDSDLILKVKDELGIIEFSNQKNYINNETEYEYEYEYVTGMYYKNLGQIDNAIKWFQYCSVSPDVFYQLSILYLQKKDYENCIINLKNLNKIYNNMKNKDISELVELVEQDKDINIKYIEYLLGIIYKNDNKIDKAFEFFKKSSDHGDPYAHYELGMYYKNNNQIDKAFEFLKKSSAMDVYSAHYELGLYYKNINEFDKAIQLFKKSIYHNSYEIRIDSYKQLIIIYKSLGNIEETIKYYKILLDKNIDVNYELGLLYIQKKDYKNALLYLFKDIEDNGDNKEKKKIKYKNLFKIVEKTNKSKFDIIFYSYIRKNTNIYLYIFYNFWINFHKLEIKIFNKYFNKHIINNFGSHYHLIIAAFININRCDFNTTDFICDIFNYPLKNDITDTLITVKNKINLFKKNRKRFIIQGLTIDIDETSSHANLLIYDKKYNIIELFNPSNACILNHQNFKDILELYLGQNNVTTENVINNSISLSNEFHDLLINDKSDNIYKNYLLNSILNKFDDNFDSLKIQYIESLFEWNKILSTGYCSVWVVLYFYFRCILFSNYEINYNDSDFNDNFFKYLTNQNPTLNVNNLMLKYKYIITINNIYYHFIKNIIKHDYKYIDDQNDILIIKKYVHYYYTYFNHLRFTLEEKYNTTDLCNLYKNLPYFNTPCYNIPNSFPNLFLNYYLNINVINLINIIDKQTININEKIYKSGIPLFDSFPLVKTTNLPMSYIPLTIQKFINQISLKHIPSFANKSLNKNLLYKAINIINKTSKKPYITLKDVFDELKNNKSKTMKLRSKIKFPNKNKKKIEQNYTYIKLSKN